MMHKILKKMSRSLAILFSSCLSCLSYNCICCDEPSDNFFKKNNNSSICFYKPDIKINNIFSYFHPRENSEMVNDNIPGLEIQIIKNFHDSKQVIQLVDFQDFIDSGDDNIWKQPIITHNQRGDLDRVSVFLSSHLPKSGFLDRPGDRRAMYVELKYSVDIPPSSQFELELNFGNLEILDFLESGILPGIERYCVELFLYKYEIDRPDYFKLSCSNPKGIDFSDVYPHYTNVYDGKQNKERKKVGEGEWSTSFENLPTIREEVINTSSLIKKHTFYVGLAFSVDMNESFRANSYDLELTFDVRHHLNNEKWGDEQAHIIDLNGNIISNITDLDTSHICGITYGDIVDDNGNKYSRNKFDFELHLNPNLTNIGDNFMSNCINFNRPIVLPTALKSIGRSFMNNCEKFDQTLTLPNSLKTIGSFFMSDCCNFNKKLILPNSLIDIDQGFMNKCDNFNQDLILPNSLKSIGGGFMYNCNNFTSCINIQDLDACVFKERNTTLACDSSVAAAYVNGIKIIGESKNIDSFLFRFPNSNQRPYRKMLVNLE